MIRSSISIGERKKIYKNIESLLYHLPSARAEAHRHHQATPRLAVTKPFSSVPSIIYFSNKILILLEISDYKLFIFLRMDFSMKRIIRKKIIMKRWRPYAWMRVVLGSWMRWVMDYTPTLTLTYSYLTTAVGVSEAAVMKDISTNYEWKGKLLILKLNRNWEEMF